MSKPQTVEVNVELLRFLKGEKAIDGKWFGDTHPDIRGKFWWRKLLPDVPEDVVCTDCGGKFFCTCEDAGVPDTAKYSVVKRRQDYFAILEYRDDEREDPCHFMQVSCLVSCSNFCGIECRDTHGGIYVVPFFPAWVHDPCHIHYGPIIKNEPVNYDDWDEGRLVPVAVMMKGGIVT